MNVMEVVHRTELLTQWKERLQSFLAACRSAPCKGVCFPAGANPARPLLLRPEATGAAVEATKRLKPLV